MSRIKNLNIYALYKGEELLATGTIFEIAEELNIKVQTVRKYGTQSYLNSLKKEGISLDNARVLIKIGKVFNEDLEGGDDI